MGLDRQMEVQEPKRDVMPEEDARVIGQAMLDLAARLPDFCTDTGYGNMCSPSLHVSYDAVDQLWEVEYGALDAARNFTMSDESLEVAVRRALERDRKAAPDA